MKGADGGLGKGESTWWRVRVRSDVPVSSYLGPNATDDGMTKYPGQIRAVEFDHGPENRMLSAVLQL